MLAVFLLNTVNAHGSELAAGDITHVNAVAQDENRNVYLSTHSGVYRFDGRNYYGLSGLPESWANSIIYNKQINSLFVAFNTEGVWKYQLDSQTAEKISDIKGEQLALSKQVILINSLNILHTMDLTTKITTQVLKSERRILDIAANSESNYALTESGVYSIDGVKVKEIESIRIRNGSITATPYGVSYFRDDTLVSYSTLTDTFTYNYDIKLGHHLTYVAPHSLYFVDAGYVKSATLGKLEISQETLNQYPNTYKDLFVDLTHRLWGVKTSSFDVFDLSVSFQPIFPPSRYNVIKNIDDELWLGTKNGIFVKKGDQFQKLAWLNLAIPANTTITNISEFVNKVIVSTSKGSYLIDVTTQTVRRLFAGYVINASVLNNRLYLATDDHGVVIFNESFEVIKSNQLNKSLPDTEILSVRELSTGLFVATAKGLWDQSNNITHLPNMKISDVAEFDERLFASSYGKGLFEKVGEQWIKRPSPFFITELVNGDNDLFVATSDGLHWLTQKNFTKVLPDTKGHHYIPGSVHYSPNQIVIASQDGLLTIRNTVLMPEPEPAHISYVKFAGKTILNVDSQMIKVENTNWVDIALTDYSFNQRLNKKYQYRIDGQAWHSLVAPLIQLNNLYQGTYSIEYRNSIFNGWGETTTLKLVVTGPWYSSNIAYAIYAGTAGISLLLLIFNLFRWMRSFHRIFKTLNRDTKKDITKVLKLICEGSTLCGGNDVALTEGLVKLKEAQLILIPIAHNHANLGSNSLRDGVTNLQTSCAVNHVSVECSFDLTLGEQLIERKLEQDIYTIVYHAVTNALQHSKCTTLYVYVNKVQDSITVEVKDNGIGTTFAQKNLDFGLGHYLIKRIAKERGTKVKWFTKGKKGYLANSIVVTFPIILDKVALEFQYNRPHLIK
jgi:hypothetical protein